MSKSDIFNEIKEVFNNYPDGKENLELLKNGAEIRGIRINTLKADQSLFKSLAPTPFCKEGRYISAEFKAGSDALHHAGAYYVQEPSATSAVELLDVEKGDVVLDLCAAPGGKSTQIAAKLDSTGLLVSNEIFYKRAKIIVSNFERLGVFSAAVTSFRPDEMEQPFCEFFDKILVDAPCSGEGMIKKHPEIIDDWTKENVLSCKQRQLKILDSAEKMLKPGGTLVYSTCTYSKEENEEVVEEFLQSHDNIKPQPVNADFGRKAINLSNAVRILPKDGGEGHFAAKFKKTGEITKSNPENKENPPKEIAEFLSKEGVTLPNARFKKANDTYFLLPLFRLPDVKYIRFGIPIGEIRKGRLIPEHALYTCPLVKCEKELCLPRDSKEIKDFLHGEEISCPNALSGYVRVTVDNIPLGFGKASSGRLKNYYPKGLRTL